MGRLLDQIRCVRIILLVGHNWIRLCVGVYLCYYRVGNKLDERDNGIRYKFINRCSPAAIWGMHFVVERRRTSADILLIRYCWMRIDLWVCMWSSGRMITIACVSVHFCEGWFMTIIEFVGQCVEEVLSSIGFSVCSAIERARPIAKKLAFHTSNVEKQLLNLVKDILYLFEHSFWNSN